MIPESEAIEQQALEDLHSAAPETLVETLGLAWFTSGPSTVSLAEKLPASAIVINRALGFGLAGEPGDAALAAALEEYAAREIERYFIQLHPDAQPASMLQQISEAGLEQGRGWQKFSRGRQGIDIPETNLSVREVGPEYGEDFARIVCAGFDLGQQAEPWLAGLPGREGWHVFMSFDADRPAGAGALFVRGSLAWMDWAATDPDYRRRGGQSAVLAARVQHALDLGCEQMFTCTGVAVEGDEQHSYKNIRRAGFVETYVRKNYAPPKN